MTEDINQIISNGDIHDQRENKASNTSNNRPFRSILNSEINRRKLMGGSLTIAASSFLVPQLASAKSWDHKKRTSLVNFKPVAIADITDSTMPVISEDYQYQVLIPWGTPIEPGITNEYTGDPNTRPSSAEAALQTGLGHDGMWFFPKDTYLQVHYGKHYLASSDEGMLCVNHEYGNNHHALGKDEPESLEDVRLSQNIHGVSVVNIEKNRRTNQWEVKKSSKARRINVNTPVMFSGPAATSNLLQNPNGNIPLGTVNNCGSGATPWGTYLTCEENFNGYFGANNSLVATEEQERYGFSETGFGYGWHRFDKRFDLSNDEYINEHHRFGWIVEIDPFDASQKPVKRTAMGRIKHEAVAIAQAKDGRIAAYMGDDQRFDYCYKYVSNQPWQAAIKNNQSPLDDGKLYVARFNENGTGEWLELTINNPVLSERFSSQAEILIYTRIAADILGATPMDRPEWTTIGKNGEVFWTLTNNNERTEANAANPETPNEDGHIIRMIDGNDHLGIHFNWNIFILASSTRDSEEVFTDPDAAYADADGRLFIGTDGTQPDGLQDQLIVFDTTQKTPVPKRLFVGVASDEITGFTLTPDQRTAFINMQHPGNGLPIETNFPAPFDGETIPRDCTLVITRKDGGVIGS